MNKINEMIRNRKPITMYLVIEKIFKNEKMEIYTEIACVRILELCDEMKLEKDIILDITDCTVKVTLFGFLMVKHIMLSYISEEKYEQYVKLLRLHTEEANLKNKIVKILQEQKNKELKEWITEIQKHPIGDEDGARIMDLINEELESRKILTKVRFLIKSAGNKLRNSITLYKVLVKLKFCHAINYQSR